MKWYFINERELRRQEEEGGDNWGSRFVRGNPGWRCVDQKRYDAFPCYKEFLANPEQDWVSFDTWYTIYKREQ